MKKSISLFENLILLSAISMFIYSLIGYIFLPPGTLAPALKPSFDRNIIAIISHAVFSSIAIITGAIQLRKKWRARFPVWNIRLRYIYFVSVIIGGISGLILALEAYAGFANLIGFSLLAILWLFTTYKAYIAQKNKNMPDYKIWIVRSYALTFSAVTLRFYMGIFFWIFGYLQFEYFYATLGFLCWVPNIILVEWAYLLPKLNSKLTLITKK
jgi:hypothetical protein